MTDVQLMIMELAAKHYSCAQIILTGGLRLLERDNPDLIRAVGGLAQGAGGSGGICGALTGGLCFLSLHAGKGRDDEEAHEKELLMHSELIRRFQEACSGNGSIECDSLLEVDADGVVRTMQSQRCGGLIAWVWEESLKLLVEYGFDPYEGRPLD